MPELPEVETTRRGLEPHVVGKVIAAAEVRRSRMVRRQHRDRDFAERIVGRRVLGLRRHGKAILGDLDGDLTWVTHLGMSGRISVATAGSPEPPHANVVLSIKGTAEEVRFVDPRTFGYMAVFTPDELAEWPPSKWGPDALAELPSAAKLREVFARRSAPIKAVLLDQGVVAGLGNIYADEVLFRAKVAPTTPANVLSTEQVAAVRKAVSPVLKAGLRHGGTSLNDLAYLLPDGRAGDYLSRLKAYGRDGEPCERCGTAIRRTVVRQRSSFWCPKCQPS
ncbi:MAG: bifunctional DNA-formamidopyrimidine glycosylase/DNA-(apurinic or apyrimidinic site) lyase [Acidimicrobiia bacterium]|nr:bifunctional DNA-formamidopyrimidine glycosylase/DNA-(apurinic or apyrimidinic site) lyase [Acidimicrobiia bacterium]